VDNEKRTLPQDHFLINEENGCVLDQKNDWQLSDQNGLR